MNYTQWSSDFETGFSAIDKDHRGLFETIQKLGQDIQAQKGQKDIRATIDSLLLYVAEHFEREERFMLRAGYPDFLNHKKAHDAFTDTVYSLRDFHNATPEAIDAQKIVSFLENWLIDHILKIDKQYEDYLSGKKIGDPDIQYKVHDQVVTENFTLNCTKEQFDLVTQFMSLLQTDSTESDIVRTAVAKVSDTQGKRRMQQAQKLFGS